MRPVLSNLGFVMQIAGIFTIFPIISAFYLNETSALIPFFVTGFTFFILGFVLNALSERVEMSYRHSCVLLGSSFFMLSLLGSIPYVWINPFGQEGLADIFTNSFFESASGFTTTGLSLITDLDSIPRSLAFYRSLTELIGGLGIVLIILAFFYKGNTIQNISRVISLMDVSKNLKRSFVSIMLVYLLYLGALTGAFYFLGFTNILDVVSVVISGLMTGGLSPVSKFSSVIFFPANVLIMVSMVLGSVGFLVHYKIFSMRFREALKKELLLFLGIIVSASAFLYAIYGFDASETIFHVISASSTTGFSTWDFSGFGNDLKLLFVVLMFIGGMSISTAGGVKVLRLAVFLKSVPAIVRSILLDREVGVGFDGKSYSVRDISVNTALILLSILAVFTGSVALSSAGFPFIDSVFEATSAFATTGLSVGITSLSLLPHLKWVLILLMLVGRIEIIPFLVMFVKDSDGGHGHEKEGRRLARLTQP